MRAILTYHSIDPSGSPISVHPRAFERHVDWLRSGRVRVTTVEQLVQLPAAEDAVAITFDDGFANFLDAAAPSLLADHLPITIFVVTGRVGLTNAWSGRPEASIPCLPLLDWPALARLCEQGVALGAHSRTHADLTRLDATAVEDEVNLSAEAIEHQTGFRPTVFAYPYGRLNRSVSSAVAQRFQYACTTEFRTVADTVVPSELPRLDMYYFQNSWPLRYWGSSAFAGLVRLRHGARRVRQGLATYQDQHATL